MTKTRQIIVTFPVGVDLGEEERELHDLVSRICKRYEAANPGRVMWPFGWGSYCTSMPITAEDEETGVPLEFDMETLHCEVSEREDYRWPCAKCGIEQGEHAHCTVQPKAGACEFAPVMETPPPAAGQERPVGCAAEHRRSGHQCPNPSPTDDDR